MTRIMYEVTATITDPSITDDWIRWIAEQHINDILQAGATHGRLVRLDDPRNTFVVQYEFPSRQAYEHYQAAHAPRLRAESARRFEPAQVSYTRRSGEILA